MNHALAAVPAGQAAAPGPLEIEDRVSRANALIYLLSSALARELEMSDDRKPRRDSTAAGLCAIEAEARDSLASLVV